MVLIYGLLVLGILVLINLLIGLVFGLCKCASIADKEMMETIQKEVNDKYNIKIK